MADDPVKAAAKEAANDIFREEVKAYREHLEAQFSHLKWGVGVIGGAILLAVTVFITNSTLAIPAQVKGAVADNMVRYGIDGVLRTQLEDQVANSISLVIKGKDKLIKTEVDNAVEAKLKTLPGKAIDSMLIPTGTIIASALTQEQLNKRFEHGDSGQEIWVLAGGQDVQGSVYAAATGNNTVPDLRGVFLRGINHERDRQRGDPDGQREIGKFQEDRFRSHTHDFQMLHPNTPYDDDSTNAMGVSPVTTGTRVIGKTEHAASQPITSETRPRNVAVNFFIKIN